MKQPIVLRAVRLQRLVDDLTESLRLANTTNEELLDLLDRSNDALVETADHADAWKRRAQLLYLIAPPSLRDDLLRDLGWIESLPETIGETA